MINDNDVIDTLAELDNHKLLLGRWVTQDVFENGKELVRSGPKKLH